MNSFEFKESKGKKEKKKENIQSSQDKQQTLVQYRFKHQMFTLIVKKMK